MNHQGVKQQIKKVSSMVDSAYSLEEIVHMLKTGQTDLAQMASIRDRMKTNYFMEQKGSL